MIDINKVFTAEEFKWYRNAMGLTQQEMADKLDVTRQTINRLENNVDNNCTRNKKIYSICYQQFWDALYSDEERMLRSQIADLGVNMANASDKLIKLAKDGKLKDL